MAPVREIRGKDDEYIPVTQESSASSELTDYSDCDSPYSEEIDETDTEQQRLREKQQDEVFGVLRLAFARAFGEIHRASDPSELDDLAWGSVEQMWEILDGRDDIVDLTQD